MTFTKDGILDYLIAAYTGPGSAEEGSFAGDVLRACADAMAQLWSMEIDGLEQRAFVSTATGDWLTKVCIDRGVERREGESDDTLRARALEKLSSLPASGNADHYAAWCSQVPDILRVRVLPLARGAGTVNIVAVNLEGKTPSPDTLEQAQNIVDTQRPIGADAMVIGAGEAALSVSASVVLTDSATLSAVQTSFDERLAAFCLETALHADTVSYAKVLQLLLETEGVADVTALTLNNATTSLALGQTQVPVVGTITLTEVTV